MRRLSLVAFVLFLLAPPARAADTQPGDACSTANQVQTTGGAENGGTRDFLICNGTTWQGQVRFASSGYVGIGTSSPATTLDVSGSIRSLSYNAGASTTINWANGNEQYTTASCAAFSFSGLQDGGTYELLVEGTTSGTCSFSNSDSPSLTFRLPSSHGATTSGSMTLYHFVRFGTYVIVEWMPGL